MMRIPRSCNRPPAATPRRVSSVVLTALFALTGVGHVDAQTLSRLPGFPPDVSDIRAQFADSAFAPLSTLARFDERVVASRRGAVPVRVSTEFTPAHAYMIFVPQRDDAFAVDTAGTYVLRRSRSDALADQIKIFLRDGPDFFVRVFPIDHDRTEMDVYLGGVRTHHRIPLPVGIRRVLEEPLDRLLALTDRRVAWARFYPPTDHDGYRVVGDMAELARSLLHTLPDAEDGAMDEHGNLVLIESLRLQGQPGGFNCSGFAKWIVDGLMMGQFGRWLAIDPLRRKHLEIRGHQWSHAAEDDRDPYFGLDWTRNLATALLSASLGVKEVHPESADVRSVAFSEYREDVGYPVVELARVLYLLAVAEPGHLYLGSFNREFGGDRALNQHVHIAVLFPFFDDAGVFRIVVLERNVESSIESLSRRFGRDHVHLVRIRADDSFTPPIIHD